MLQRRTQQRGAIRRVLRHADRPLSPQEIHAAARGAVPGLGMATVYRNVKSLVGAGWLKTVDLFTNQNDTASYYFDNLKVYGK